MIILFKGIIKVSKILTSLAIFKCNSFKGMYVLLQTFKLVEFIFENLKFNFRYLSCFVQSKEIFMIFMKNHMIYLANHLTVYFILGKPSISKTKFLGVF